MDEEKLFNKNNDSLYPISLHTFTLQRNQALTFIYKELVKLMVAES